MIASYVQHLPPGIPEKFGRVIHTHFDFIWYVWIFDLSFVLGLVTRMISLLVLLWHMTLKGLKVLFILYWFLLYLERMLLSVLAQRQNQSITMYGKEWKLWKRRTLSTSQWDKSHVEGYWEKHPEASTPINSCTNTSTRTQLVAPSSNRHMPIIDPLSGVPCGPLSVTDTVAFIHVIRPRRTFVFL